MKKFIIDLIFRIIKLLIFLWLYKKVGFEMTVIVILCNILDKGE